MVGPCLFSAPVQSVCFINRGIQLELCLNFAGRHGKRRKAAYSATQQLGHPVRVQKLLPGLSWCLKSNGFFEGKCAQTESRTAWASVDLTTCLTLFDCLTRGWVVSTPLNVWLNWPVKLCCECTAWSLGMKVSGPRCSECNIRSLQIDTNNIT